MAQAKYSCTNCSRSYKEKFNYDRHVVYCEFVHLSAREQQSQLEEKSERPPTMKQMYRWMQEMALRIDRLEKDNAKLKSMQKNHKKINIVDWLNGLPRPAHSFTTWLQQTLYPSIKTNLEVVYEENLTQGIYKTLCSALKSTSNADLPIRAFTKQANIFYVLGEDGQWTIVKTDALDIQLSRIAHRFIVEFKNHWYVPNQAKIETEEKYMDLYTEYYQRILGGNERAGDEARYQKVRQMLYKHMAENLDIVEYEIS